jgi:P2 family phage contractile tail tube protein
MDFGFPNILHDFECWINNEAKLGMAESVTLEGLVRKKEGHIGGGMSGEVEIHYAAHDVIKAKAELIDVATRDIQLFTPRLKTEEIQFRGAITAQGREGFDDLVFFMRGHVDIEFKEWKPAAKAGVTLSISCSYLHIMRAGLSVMKLDPQNGHWGPSGDNMLRGKRQALGFGG